METIKRIDIHAHAIASPLTPPHKLTGERFPAPEMLLEKFYDPLDIGTGVLLPIIAPEAHWFQMTNEDALRIVAQHPDRFAWFCNVDPRAGDNTAGADLSYLLNYYRELGAKGVGEITANLWADDPMMDNLFTHCGECGLPVLFHVSPAPGINYGIADEPGLPRIERMLKKHPRLTFIGHSQPFWTEISDYPAGMDRNGYPSGPVTGGALTRLMRDYGNLCCDLSAGSGCNAMTRDRDHAASFLNEFADRIFFGCDVCVSTNTHPFRLTSFLEELRSDGSISEAVYRKICRENAARLLGFES